MKFIDVFNGDADGICALIQYRLAYPVDAILVTGVKRDIKLLEKIQVKKGDKVSVFDLSMNKNNIALKQILSDGASVFYVDHHLSGDIPNHPALEAIIDTSSQVCTSLLVDSYLKGRYREWAIVAAFGDNILSSAITMAEKLTLSQEQIRQLKRLGISINYNGYGRSVDDLHFKPDQLYKEMLPYESPFDFINDEVSIYQDLQIGYDNDIAKTGSLKADSSTENSAIYRLPNEPWARRVSGVFSNQLANQFPNRAHAVLTQHQKGGYLVSVRAPLNNLNNAGELCQKFSTGGGRKGAAGINHLAESELGKFIDLLEKTYA